LYNTVRTFRCHAAYQHKSYWENSNVSAASFVVNDDNDDDDDNTCMDVDDDVNAHESHSNDETKANILLNDFAKHLAFLKLKIMEDNILPATAAISILKDMQVCFETYQQQFVQLVRNHLQSLDVEWNADAVLKQLLSDNSFFDRCQNKFESDYLFSKFLEENMKLNCPVLCKVANNATSGKNDASNENCSNDSSGSNGSAHVSAVNTDAHDCEFHYVPILETLKTYLQQSDVWASCQQKRNSGGMLHDFRDGRMWQNSSVDLNSDGPMYTVSQKKTSHFNFRHNFAIC